jgi:hypothetical protein
MTDLSRPDLTPKIVHLASARMPVVVGWQAPGSPLGTSLVGGVEGRWEGERLNASVRPPSADWAIVTADGKLIHTAVKILLETDDGAIIFVNYTGRVVSGTVLYAGMTFETGDERYGWLNEVVAIAKGSIFATESLPRAGVVYEIYEAQ